MSSYALIKGTLARAGALGVIAVTALGLAAPASPALARPHPQLPPAVGAGGTGRSSPRRGTAMRQACTPAPRREQCFVLYREQTSANRAAAAGDTAAGPTGLTPADIRSAYRLPSGHDSRQTVAVSIAYNTPDLAQSLAYYRRYFGLPPCGTGCLKIVNQRGQSAPLPASSQNTGWDMEATLDVSMISAACPTCHILVVEAASAADADLAATDNTAARLGAQVISNSYGSRENGFTMSYAASYDHPGHTIVAAAGDGGFGEANFPADLATVTAAGGTQLTRARDARGWTEQVWDARFFGAGASGCSAYVAKPSWQHDKHCPGRTIADVAAVAADVPIYNKYWHGWLTVSGTSIAAPLIAGIYGLAGNAARLPPGSLYQHPRQLFDITAGNNSLYAPPGPACGNDYLCVAKEGYDAPTGLGTPDGTGAF